MEILPVSLIMVLTMGLLSGYAFATEDTIQLPPYLVDLVPTPNEKALLEQGFGIREYPYIPFGYKHFFYKHDSFYIWSDVGMDICRFSATYPLRHGESVNVSLKFPKDLVWSGSYDTSGFFVGRGGTHSYVDSSGNSVSKKTEIQWEKLQPATDSEFITIEYNLRDELSHILITKSGLPEWPSSEFREENCPRIPPILEYDYYDGVNSIQRQKEYGELMKFAPDVYICEGNLVGAIKSTDGKSVCVKPETKEKLIERKWATQFEV